MCLIVVGKLWLTHLLLYGNSCFPSFDQRKTNLIVNIEDLIENGMFNYNYLETLFTDESKYNEYLGNIVFKKLNSKDSRISPKKLIVYARMAPLTQYGYQVISNLMIEFAKLVIFFEYPCTKIDIFLLIAFLTVCTFVFVCVLSF